MPPTPPKRKVWDEARAAEALWAHALTAHSSAAPGTPGLGTRLRATAAAATQMAVVARRANEAGLAWAKLPDDGREADALRGELAAPNRWLCTEWVAVETAERRAAETARTGSVQQLADAFDALAQAFTGLAGVAEGPHGPRVGDAPPPEPRA